MTSRRAPREQPSAPFSYGWKRGHVLPDSWVNEECILGNHKYKLIIEWELVYKMHSVLVGGTVHKDLKIGPLFLSMKCLRDPRFP